MSVVIGVFEEFTAFTDFTQQWIEFNFFIFYWDKLTITRTYLAFLFIYGALVIAGKILAHFACWSCNYLIKFYLKLPLIKSTGLENVILQYYF